MGGISGLLNISTQALLVDQAVLNTINHNIANANTPGYSKQDVVIGIQSPETIQGGFVGRGTLITTIKRSFDKYLVAQEMVQGQNFGKSSSLDQAMSQIEQVFNEAKGLGLSTQMNEYFNAWNDVAANPESQAQRTVLLQKANSMVVAAQIMERSAADTLKYSNLKVEDIATQINAIAANIARLNAKIVESEAGLSSQKANDYRDQRDNFMQQLSNLTTVASYEGANGDLTVMMGMRNLISGERTNTLSTKANGDGNRDLYLDNTNITSRLGSGQIGGLITARNDIETNALKGLRKLVAAITNETNKLHSKGFGLNSTVADFTVSDITAQQFPATLGSILNASITDINTFVPGEYDIRFNAAVTQYDVYKDGVLLSSANAYAPDSIVLNGMTINFDPLDPPQANDQFYISAKGQDFFTDLTASAVNRDSSLANVTSATIFNREAVKYNEYEVRFTGPATYDVYNVDTGLNVITGAAYGSGGTISFDGMNVVITDGTGAPVTGDRFLISPVRTAISGLGVKLTDSRKVAAASLATALPGDNTNALKLTQLVSTNMADLGNATLTDYYRGVIATIGSSARSAADSNRFDDNLLNEMRKQRDAVSGVSLDEEAANLVRFQRAYQAAAKMVSVADELLQSILAMR